MFENDKLYSPNNQRLIWSAEYLDGNCLNEFDFETGKENEFKDIQQDKLLRFGLIGNGTKSYFEVYSGIFKVVGQMIQISYVTDAYQYDLMGQPLMYSDIITYKNAEFLFDPQVQNSGSNIISQFNFGYKQKLHIHGVNFSFQSICQFPINDAIRFHLKIVSDNDLNGRIVIRRNNVMVDEFEAPLKKNIGGEITWQMK